MNTTTWERCLGHLEVDLTPQQYNTWIRPLHVVENGSTLHLLAPNQFVRDQVIEHFVERIKTALHRCGSAATDVTVRIGSRANVESVEGSAKSLKADTRTGSYSANGLRADFTFNNFVEGKSNQIARAASIRVASNPGNTDSHPLFIYGGTGLGKTHLMQAIGNQMLKKSSSVNVVYLHSEQFVAEMVTALQNNVINEFKKYYRSVDALLIDDVQFFAGKERSQEEFFHTFNSLIGHEKLVVMTSDRYPKEIHGIESRLKSRLGGGLPISIEPPELETRMAILKKKAEAADVVIPDGVTYFIAARMHSNVRELEGALCRVIAHANFTGRMITVDLAKEALRDLIRSHDRLATIENIQRTVARHFNIRVTDLLSKKRTRSIARPRQIAMALCEDLTNHSLPEIGDAFGGRDHTTVIYARRKIAELRERSVTMSDDYTALLRLLTT